MTAKHVAVAKGAGAQVTLLSILDTPFKRGKILLAVFTQPNILVNYIIGF